MAAAPKATRLTAEQRREQLLDTAAQILVTRGLDALTMEAVGSESGASKTLAYAYFPNVESIVRELWRRELSRLYERVVGAVEGRTDLSTSIMATTSAYYEAVRERGALLATLQAGMTALHLDVDQEPETLDFVGWLAHQIAKEYGVSRSLAIHYASLAAQVAAIDITARAGRRRDREGDARCLRFITAGLEAALRDEHSDTGRRSRR